jgi:N-acetylmuramoyl-L-alanine amidase CwlA
MIVGVHGSKNFEDYQIFLRAMGTALSMLKEKDNEIILYSAGPSKINSMSMEFSNVVERSMKSRGIKIKMYKAPIKWLKENIDSFDYFIYLSKPKENLSEIASLAEKKGIDLGVYRY